MTAPKIEENVETNMRNESLNPIMLSYSDRETEYDRPPTKLSTVSISGSKRLLGNTKSNRNISQSKHTFRETVHNTTKRLMFDA